MSITRCPQQQKAITLGHWVTNVATFGTCTPDSQGQCANLGTAAPRTNLLGDKLEQNATLLHERRVRCFCPREENDLAHLNTRKKNVVAANVAMIDGKCLLFPGQ